MTRSFVVRVSEICCWALGFVGARVRWEDVRLVVTSFIACWGARCCLQAHIRYRVKFVARVLECLLFASSCQLCCQVCSSFGSPATPRGKVVGTILRQRSCCGSLKSSNFSLAFYNIAEGGGGAPSKSHGFLYDKIAHFGGTSFSSPFTMPPLRRPRATLCPCGRGPPACPLLTSSPLRRSRASLTEAPLTLPSLKLLPRNTF